MFVGICIVLQPIVVFVDIIPLVGDFMEGCIGGYIIPFVAFCISFPFTLLTISIAWVFYRPVFAAISVALALLTYYVVSKVFKSKPKVSDEVDGRTTRYATINAEMRRRKEDDDADDPEK
jgi:membrane protein implicated in regulation of membrane protease activity